MSNSNSNSYFKSNDAQKNIISNSGNNYFGFFGNNNHASLYENKNIKNGIVFWE